MHKYLLLLSLFVAACTSESSLAPDDGGLGADAGDGGVTGDGGAAIQATIYRDPAGVPHIVSATDEGAMFGLGYVSAADRLFHINLSVMLVQGRLAEVLGDVPMAGQNNGSTVDFDKRMRYRGYWRHAQQVVQKLDAETLSFLQAYADGVNQYVSENAAQLHPLFATLGVQPMMWTPAHSVAAWYGISQYFSSDGLKKAKALHDFEDDVATLGLNGAIQEWVCGQSAGDPDAAVVQQTDVPQATQDAIDAFAQASGLGTPVACPTSLGTSFQIPGHYTPREAPKFSHAWVVGGAKSQTGSAALVSDPQTPVTLPSIWQEFAIHGKTLIARGVTIPGSPGLLVGMTPTLAWGLTAAGGEQADLFRLDIDPADANAYMYDGVSTAMLVETETIKVKGGADVEITYRESIHGPVVTPIVPNAAGEQFAMKLIPFADSDRDTVQALFAMMRSRNVDDLAQAIADFRYPTANLVAGDSAGDIFYTLIGAFPLRSAASPLGGVIAQDGSQSSHNWQGTIPAEYLPHVKNPAAGYIYSANHRPVGPWYPLPLGLGTGSKGHGQRSARLAEMLGALSYPATAQDVFDLHYDCVDPNRRDMVLLGKYISDGNGAAPLSTDAQSAVDALIAWALQGGSLATDTPEALLASAVNTNFRLSDTGPQVQQTYGGGQNGYVLFTQTLTQLMAQSMQIGAAETAFIDKVLADAWATVRGVNPSAWVTTYQSKAMPKLEYFALIGNIPTLDSSLSYRASTPLRCIEGSTIQSQKGQSYTQFVDLADVDSSQAVLPPGISDNPAGSWLSQATLWETGQLRPAKLSKAAIEAELTMEATVGR